MASWYLCLAAAFTIHSFRESIVHMLNNSKKWQLPIQVETKLSPDPLPISDFASHFAIPPGDQFGVFLPVSVTDRSLPWLDPHSAASVFRVLPSRGFSAPPARHRQGLAIDQGLGDPEDIEGRVFNPTESVIRSSPLARRWPPIDQSAA
jgi:hypothetical protein